MRIQILACLLLAVFLMIFTPSISAIQVHTIMDANTKTHIDTENFVDIAVILTILNIILMKMAAGFPMNAKGAMNTVYIMVYLFSLIQLVKQEYSSGEQIPRYKAYQLYFSSLFSIVNVIIAKSLADVSPRISATIMVLLFFVITFLTRYLGNTLYVLLGRPGG